MRILDLFEDESEFIHGLKSDLGDFLSSYLSKGITRVELTSLAKRLRAVNPTYMLDPEQLETLVRGFSTVQDVADGKIVLRGDKPDLKTPSEGPTHSDMSRMAVTGMAKGRLKKEL